MKTLLTITTVLLGTAHALFATDERAKLRESAKSVVEKHGTAVVGVSATLEQKQGGMGVVFNMGNRGVEILGTVVDKSGLTITSLSQLNPMNMIGVITFENPDGDGPITINNDADVGEIQIHYRDKEGKEEKVDARLIMVDKEHDLAFLLPKNAEKEFAYINLLDAQELGDLKMLDGYISMSKLSGYFDKQTISSFGAVQCTVEKGGKVYPLLMGGTFGGGGGGAIAMMVRGGAAMPIFDIDGHLLGVSTAIYTAEENGRKHFHGSVITPAKEIQALVQQALEAVKR